MNANSPRIKTIFNDTTIYSKTKLDSVVSLSHQAISYMRKDEFIKLTIPQRMEFLWREGEIISEKVYYDNNITLFLLDTYLVEVFFNRIYNEIVGVEIQENNQILFEYVKDLELSELLNS